MTSEEIRSLIQETLKHNQVFPWWQYLTWLAVAGVGAYLGTYLREKGKNTATKEDVADITRKVEEVKTDYLKELETLKSELDHLSKKRSLLFDERIRVFKRLQARLTNFKKYCIAARGSLGYGGEYHPNLESLDREIDRPALAHLTALQEILEEDGVFLSEVSQAAMNELMNQFGTFPGMEQATFGNEDDPAFARGAIEHYGQMVTAMNECLLKLFHELDLNNQQVKK